MLLLRRAKIEGQLKSIAAVRNATTMGPRIDGFRDKSPRRTIAWRGATASTWDSELFQLTDRDDSDGRLRPGHPHVVALRERIAAVRTSVPGLTYCQLIAARCQLGPVERDGGTARLGSVQRFNIRQ